jgi:hypothetical protein
MTEIFPTHIFKDKDADSEKNNRDGDSDSDSDSGGDGDSDAANSIFDFVFSFFIDKKKTYENIKKYVKERCNNFYTFSQGNNDSGASRGATNKEGSKNYLNELEREDLLELVTRLAAIFKIDYFIFDYGTSLNNFENRIQKNGEIIVDMEKIGSVDFEKGVMKNE